MSDIRTRPATDKYRQGYDAIFGDTGPDTEDEVDTAADIGPGTTSLDDAYAQADLEVGCFGRIKLTTAALINELGGSLDNYD